jgi:hypothetical protein
MIGIGSNLDMDARRRTICINGEWRVDHDGLARQQVAVRAGREGMPIGPVDLDDEVRKAQRR